MAKRIAFCADGTWDSSGKNTNVYKLYKRLKVASGQMPFYDDGVGSNGTPIEKLLGGAFGLGLFQKIKDGYTKIAQVYEAGDELFLFGFSRGAYTARSLAGMIGVCGLPTKDFSDAVVESAFQAYRHKDQRAEILAELNKSCEMFDAQITMVGVWDTVGSLGIPAIFGGVSPLIYGFLDTSLNPHIHHAYQALAINEKRCEFPPTLWTNPNPSQTVEQVWFAGVHCDVGGSYPDDPDGTNLADITLGWMMGKAAALGLEFVGDGQAAYGLPMDPKWALDTLHESWSPLWAFPKRRAIPADAAIADSVHVRCAHDSSWRPENLQFLANALAPGYGMAHVVTQPAATAAAASGQGV